MLQVQSYLKGGYWILHDVIQIYDQQEALIFTLLSFAELSTPPDGLLPEE